MIVQKSTFWHRDASMFRISVATLLFLAVLTGCNNEKSTNLIEQRAAEAQQTLLDGRTPQDTKRYNPLVVTDKVWAGNSAIRLHRGMPLPPKYEEARGITLVSSEPMSLSDIAAAISSQTGIPVRLADGAGGKSNGAPIAYEGPLSGLLERVSGFFGINWNFDGSSISITRFETRIFVIEAMPGTQQVKDGMQDDSSTPTNTGAQAAGAAPATNTMKQNSEMDIELKYWDELGQILTSMLGGVGNVVVSPAIGTVTVTTSPEVMRTVTQYLAQENKRLSRQIAINVEIYSVNLQEGTDFSLAFTEALKRLTNFGVTLSGPTGPTSVQGLTGGGTLSVAILNPNTVGQVTDVFNALSTIGDTTRIAQFPLTTLNNRPVSRRVGQDIGYLQSQSTNVTGTTGTTTVTLTPGVVHEGFSLQLTPRLMDDGRIILQYSLNLIDLVNILNFCAGGSSSGASSSTTTINCTGGNSIELPTTTNRIFVQQSLLKSGSTLMIGGVDEEDAKQSAQGVGNPFNFLLGGGSSNETARTMMFIAITPQVLDVPRAEQD